MIHKFKGPGQKDSLVLNFNGLIKLIMKLPGTNAKLTRTQFATIIKRHFARDPTLIQEFEEAEPSAIHEAASEAMHDQPVHEDTSEPLENEVVKKVQGELAQIQGQYAELAKRMEQIEKTRMQDEATISRLIKKKDDSERRKKLNDDKAEHKRKQENIKYTSEITVQEREKIAKISVQEKESLSKITVQEKEAIAEAEIKQSQAKMQQDIEERKKIETQMEFFRLMHTTPTPQATPTPLPKGITVKEVAAKHNLLAGTGAQGDSTLCQVGKNIQKEPYGLVPFANLTMENLSNGNSIPVHQYHPKDEPRIVNAIKDYLTKTNKTPPNQGSIRTFFNQNAQETHNLGL